MSGVLTIDEMQANVDACRRAADRHTGLIDRLAHQGHAEMAELAAKLLATLRGRLEVEAAMLAQMRAVESHQHRR